jgi:hypothetical protein
MLAVKAILFLANLTATICTRWEYLRARKRGDSLSLALNYSIYVFLFCYGLIDFIGRIGGSALGIYEPVGVWLFGVIHMGLASAVLVYRRQLYRWLGARQLRAACDIDELEALRIPATSGSLSLVEEATPF